MGTVHIFLFKLQCRLELPLVSIIKTFVTRRPFCFCWAERTRLAELKESFLNRLRQNGRRVTKVYCVQIYIVYQLCHLKKRPQFSIVYTFIDHRNDVIKSVQNSSGTTSSRRVVSLQSFEHFMASFLWSIRVQTMENCSRFVFYNDIYFQFPAKFLGKSRARRGDVFLVVFRIFALTTFATSSTNSLSEISPHMLKLGSSLTMLRSKIIFTKNQKQNNRHCLTCYAMISMVSIYSHRPQLSTNQRARTCSVIVKLALEHNQSII